MQRAKTASAIVGAGTPMSSAAVEVHLPVPFCPAASSTMSTNGLPVRGSSNARMSAVISTRNESSSPRFHSAKTAAHSLGVSPPMPRSRWKASQIICMSPYSMPLCTIFTKWPLPPAPM